MTNRSELRLALTGDSIVQRRLLTHQDTTVRPLFDLIRNADVSFTNLEVVPNDFEGDPALESGGSHFGAPAWVLDELTEAGFDLFAAATNHCLDYGVSGLLRGIDALEQRGLSFAGVGRNLEEARRPVYHTHPNGTVALLSCSATFAKGQEASAQRPDMPGRPGVNPLRYSTVYEVTPHQLSSLAEIAEQLGLERMRRKIIELGFGFPPDDPALVEFKDLRFRAAERPAIRMYAKSEDVEGIARWVREARELSDVVLVSIHTHEYGEHEESPAEFVPIFARRMIDEGASLVVGHGPHLLRGMEIYNGSPIFYSLGNFIGQNELVSRLPADSYERFRVDPQLTPGMAYWQRTDGDRKSFPADRRFWETVVPICRFKDGRLSGLEIHPVSLGLGERRHLRGRPRLAEGEEARSILNRFAMLSKPFDAPLDFGASTTTLSI
ncbi:CapA family protein [Bradyrhizobium sp. BRP22]|uniref:CapA family protein n=1 Tax=Bradyrhizobium sp. BRP22 TaxID=2793821 RepID=UPI001CD7CF45|nr:CapA family protein [Bradyrhizobium sp. BRP22]MCA1454375.1 CapA family protein [Bradyrhizobium sp. BRP22]